MMFAADAAVRALLTSGDGKVAAVANIVEVQALLSSDVGELKDRDGSDTEGGPCVFRRGIALSCYADSMRKTHPITGGHS